MTFVNNRLSRVMYQTEENFNFVQKIDLTSTDSWKIRVSTIRVNRTTVLTPG